MKKTHWKKTFNKDYLGSHDLDDGEGGYDSYKVTIDRVECKTINDPNGNKEAVRIAHFKESIKPMILNVGSCETIEGFTGSKYIEDWAGCSIQVYVDTNARLFGGQRGAAVRIASQQPRTEKPPMTTEHERFNGLVKAYADKGEEALNNCRKGYTLSDEVVQEIQKQAAALKGEAA